MLTAKTLIGRVLAREDGVSVGLDSALRGEAMRRTEERLFQEIKNVNEPRMEDDPRSFAKEAAASLFKENQPQPSEGSLIGARLRGSDFVTPLQQDTISFPHQEGPSADQFSNEGVGEVPVSVIAKALAHRLGPPPEEDVFDFDDDDFVFNLKQ